MNFIPLYFLHQHIPLSSLIEYKTLYKMNGLVVWKHNNRLNRVRPSILKSIIEMLLNFSLSFRFVFCASWFICANS